MAMPVKKAIPPITCNSRDAVAKKAGPDDVQQLVGQPPLINTRRAAERNALMMADIAPDPEYQNVLPDLRAATDVMYWNRGWTPHSVRIVGLVWNKQGTVEI